jgi:hypothetical protein
MGIRDMRVSGITVPETPIRAVLGGARLCLIESWKRDWGSILFLTKSVRVL